MIQRITEFLAGIGIEVERATLDDGTFLPGVTLQGGRLLVDEVRLAYPGDLLHEAGHVALVPAALRPRLSGEADVPGVDMATVETAVLPWSYAAALAAGVHPAAVFHDGGYRGHGAGLLATYSLGVYPGAALLEGFGLTATGARAAALGVAPYPHMLRWLRE
ncbi:MAG TPA: hypothetical protein VF533_11650 [Solirubrobacteraceae bacterium]